MDERSLSRRGLLKKLGAGTAVAWAAPVVATVGSKAFAQSSDACTAAALSNFNSGGPGFACGGCIPAVRCGTANPNLGCFCMTDVQRECCVCVEPLNCPGQGPLSTQAKPCNAANDCPSGWRCIYTCCNGSAILGQPDRVPPGFKGTCGKPCPSPNVISAAAGSQSSRLVAGGSQVG